MSRRTASSPRKHAAPLFEPLETRTLLAIELVKDINPSPITQVTPGAMADVNGVAYFMATYKLWKSDGTEAGTVKISDNHFFFSPSNFCNVDGTLFFAEGSQLWKSNGTSAGTVMITPVFMTPRFITAIGNRAYFRGTDGSGGEELWVSDGTQSGTYRLKDINPGTAGSDPRQLMNINGRLYFRARDASGGDELWTSDGTAAGTVRVKDINPGAGSSEPVSFTDVNGTLFFVAHDAEDAGYELWKSNGTEVGTVRVKDIRPGKPGSSPTSLRNVNGTLMFVATDGTAGYELWKSDGTEAGTVMVKDLIPGSASATLDHLTTVGTTLFFTADDETGAGIELWKSDGTAAGTARVKDINPGAAHAAPGMLTEMGGQLYFVANNGIKQEFYKSDGTEAGTMPLGGPARSYQLKFKVVGGNKIFFTSDDGFGATLWVTDGTGAGTFERPIYYEMGGSANVNSLVKVGANQLYFIGDDGVTGREIWKSDGTDAGTMLLKDLQQGIFSLNPSELTDVGGSLFFAAAGRLWKSDGTEAGTVQVSATGMSPSKFKVVGNTLYFLGFDSGGQELWKSDGTAEGTMRVADIRAGGGSSAIDYMTNVNGTLYFIADNGINGVEIWKSNGTAAGTVMVKDIITGSASSGPLLLTNVNGTLYFRASNGVNGYEIWKSDGTAAGTQMVKDIRPGAASSGINFITAAGNTAYFVADDGVNGQEIWKSDGTETGTTLTRDINPGARGSSPSNLTALNDKLIFRADNGSNGGELWISNGTTAGTEMVKDIRSGAAASDPAYFFNVEGRLYFRASDGASVGIWTSDGSSAGTFSLPDNSDARFPTFITGFNGNLYFAGYTLLHGTELRRLAMPGAAPAAIATAPATTGATAESQTLAAAFEPASSAALGGDIFYDTTSRQLKPAAVANSGVSPISIFYGSAFFTDVTNAALDETRVRALARQAADLGGPPIILDIEHWSIDNRWVNEGVVAWNLEKLLNAVSWIHDERPQLKVGFYGLMPIDATPAPAPGVGAWHAATERVRPLIDAIDELYPGLYSVNPWEAASWRAGAENMIAEARLYDKPVRPFLWPQYFYNPDQSGRLLPANVWRMELDTAHDLADGAILWDGGGFWLDDAPWWTVTRDFLIDPTPIAPAAPSGMGAAVQNAQRINLSWTDKSYNETGWRVQRRLGAPGPFVTVATLGANTKIYSDVSVSASSTYTYRVVAFNAGGESLATNEVTVTTPSGNVAPAAPVNPAANAIAPGTMRVSWIRGSSNDTGFKIERADPGGNFVQIGTAAAGATSFDDANVVAGVQYLYRVRAYNTFGDSPYSSQVAGNMPVSTKDPRALWKLDDATGTSAADSSGGGKVGAVVGATWTTGTLGGALSFDGVDDRVVVADAAELRFTATQDFTISAWVNLTTLPGRRVGIVTKAGDGIFIDATNLWVFGDITGPLAATGWTLITAVQNGAAGTRKLYVNGVEVASGSAQNANAAGDLWIGGTQSASEFFAGKIDDVRVYGSAWSAAEVNALANPHVTLNGTGGNDNFDVDIDPLTDNYRFIVNGVTVATALRDAVASINALGNAGDDQLNVNFAGGDPLADYGFAFDGAAGRDTLKIAGNRPNIAFTADATNVTRDGRSITHANAEALTLAAAAMSINASLGLDFKAEAGGAAIFTVPQKLTGLTVTGGSADVVNHPIAIDYTGSTPITPITSALASGRNGGKWNGSGIITSAPAALSLLTTHVPVEASDFLGISGAQTANWFGMTVDATTVLLVYAWAGDMNFDGIIDGDDYHEIDSGFSAQTGGYINGDLDFNGRIDADDYFIIDKNNGKGGALPSTPAAGQPAGESSAASLYFAPGENLFAGSTIESAYDRLARENGDDLLVR